MRFPGRRKRYQMFGRRLVGGAAVTTALIASACTAPSEPPQDEPTADKSPAPFPGSSQVSNLATGECLVKIPSDTVAEDLTVAECDSQTVEFEFVEVHPEEEYRNPYFIEYNDDPESEGKCLEENRPPESDKAVYLNNGGCAQWILKSVKINEDSLHWRFRHADTNNCMTLDEKNLEIIAAICSNEKNQIWVTVPN